MTSQITLPKSFWDYALETAARILNMVPTKKVDKTPYEIWHGQAPKLPSENKVFVARNAEFFESKLLDLKASGSVKDLKLIQEEDTNPSVDTSLNHEEDDQEIEEPQSDINPIRKSSRTRRVPDRMCLYMDAEEHELENLEVYMEQPEGFVNLKYPNHVCKLKRFIYGLKSFAMKDLGEAAYILGIKIYRDRSNRKYGTRAQSFLLQDSEDGSAHPNIIYEEPNDKASSSDKDVSDATLPAIKTFSIYIFVFWRVRSGGTKEGPWSYVSGLPAYLLSEIDQPAGLVWLFFSIEKESAGYLTDADNLNTQTGYVFVLNRGAVDWKSTKQSEEHWTAVKNILKYLRNTKNMFLVYGGNMERELRVSCYTDAGYLTDADNLKSQTGYVFILNGGVVDWKSTKQSIFATSSTYAEYIAAFDASKEAVWIRKFISGLGIVPTIKEPISMYCDNTGAIAIVKDDGVTKGARHFCAKVHYLRETIKLGDVKIEKIHTDANLADPFTKALAFPKHSELTRNIGLLPPSSFM
nr:retrotransposon protein, putative, Ty1-copia subclass [Tanacetum cinerariifolium]